ncbi:MULTISPECIES: arabinose-5-phosphate isomerase KdsD [Candidatus Hamiltonella]|uniref:Arabinose 5-phosphate isomerase n=2 Tax=Candidatus Williamhamiltonella defendens TaxID=138072 RepID=C4K7J3_HAMD5|nr:arabinose-5-phosphate isomerase KdsD [Candidatus Hamiltonella defensa]ACQ68536.1 D-arabinose 5-phosphate isomerase [Candidatus Hamiltonella defensa 5AT (Acyrthosiphon pisum)]ATW23076.1 D-arabinose 5-phosphate isomerase [Candidatus Hamiltonella defensa]ATW33330.1 D-arabinose 5-phosphate isomerase [Candidatus Hamiltonella defensa]
MILLNQVNYQQIAKAVLKIECAGLAQLEQYINEDFEKACAHIFSCQGKLVIMGMGKSGHIGCKIAATFASTGTPAFFVHPSEANHGDLGMISQGDIVLAISNSGEANEILSLIPLLKRQHIFLICMTADPNSTMGEAADIHLCIKVPQEACPLGLAPTTSTTATLVMGDALAVALLQARGFTEKDFARSHPGGRLGRKLLLRVSDMMHTGSDIPFVYSNASLRDTLLEMTQKKLGLTAICDHNMKIEGIFTDGDLRRVFDKQIDLNKAHINHLMTSNPVQVKPGLLAVEALNLMQLHHITALLVSKKSRLVGVVHMHDMLRSGVI